MCGIAGLWRLTGPDPVDAERLDRMAATLLHRGPDDFGYLLADSGRGLARAGRDLVAGFLPDVLLASRRLSIIDLTAAGRQPIPNEAGDVFVVFNGAIHNYVELRAELRALGHVFRSQTDTEVVVHAYEEWGEDCARRFNGMWAYVVWDGRSRRLVCSRDRFGIKPFVFAWHQDTFWFASEPKAILAGGEVRAVPNLSFVRSYLSRHIPVAGRGTAFEGIDQLPAGHNLVVTRDGGSESRYWSYADRSEQYDFGRPELTFRELFADAVRLRLRSDVSSAVLLSGGLDSSAVAVHARQQDAAEGVEAFTMTFPEFDRDERRHAELVAERSGMRLTCLEYDPSDLLDDLSSVAWHMDAPPALGQVLARWRLLEAASHRVRIVLEGQGSDEMLAGYPGRYRDPYLQAEMDQLSLRNAHRRLPRILGVRWRRRRARADSPSGERDVPTASERTRAQDIMSRDLAAVPDHADAEWAVEGVRFPDRLTAALHRDHAQRFLPHLLHFGDAISMAHSVESRLPFLDHRLVEFVFGLPFDAKMRDGETKYVLRKALAGTLPPEISRRRDKVGFATPWAEWLRPHLDGEIRPRLAWERVRDRGIFDRDGLERCLADFEAGDEGATRKVFRCLALEAWFERFIDGEPLRNGGGIVNRRVTIEGSA